MIRNERGLTLIELLVTSGIALVVIMSVTNSLRMASNFLMQVRGSRNRDRIVSSALQNVVSNVSLFQKNFNLSSSQFNQLMDPKNLPMAWDQDVVLPTNQCPQCPGRMGFVIQNIPGLAGLSQLTVRITNPSLFQGYKDYVYILSDE